MGYEMKPAIQNLVVDYLDLASSRHSSFFCLLFGVLYVLACYEFDQATSTFLLFPSEMLQRLTTTFEISDCPTDTIRPRVT